ncbi:MAG: transglycosylase SLT domain-containing protein [Treponema sp.]|nr:transglycosylase SLT domain-containing protein [Treponema sp.]
MEYRLYVRKAVQDAGVPEVLEYLPVVESNYKTNAKSRSGAIGMWQFMANSVWPFLTLNDYVDERLDPWKSTDAALKKLQDNYKAFDDWLLAIAAYNCGMGALNRILKKAEVKDFWYLVDNNLLPSQTANYVPKLLAIADLAINSEYYGIDLPSHDEEFEILENEKNGNFDYITVNKAYSISQLAQEMRMDTSAFRRLNPSYVLGMTHPSKSSEIRLPLGMKQSALDALEKIEPIEFPIKYEVTAGDSLWSISRRYKVSVSDLCELNNIDENAILKIGKILYIPAK